MTSFTVMKSSPVCGTIHINGKQHHLWRAVDQDGEVVDVFLQAKRDGARDEEVQVSWSSTAIFGYPCSGFKSFQLGKAPDPG